MPQTGENFRNLDDLTKTDGPPPQQLLLLAGSAIVVALAVLAGVYILSTHPISVQTFARAIQPTSNSISVACNPVDNIYNTYQCGNTSMNGSGGTLGMSFARVGTYPLTVYDVAFMCVLGGTSNFTAQNTTAEFEQVLYNGSVTPNQTIEGEPLAGSQPLNFTGLVCYNQLGLPIGVIQPHSSYTGELWIRFLTDPPPNNIGNMSQLKLHTVEVATLNITAK